MPRSSRAAAIRLAITLGGVAWSLAACSSTPPATSAVATPTPPPAATSPDAIDEALALETFDAAWQQVHDGHFDPTFNGVDWIAVRAELRPKAAQARTNTALRAILSDMVGRLGQSHFEIIPADAYVDFEDVEVEVAEATLSPDERSTSSGSDRSTTDALNSTSRSTTESPADRSAPISDRPGWLGFDARICGQEVVVVRVSEDSPAALAGVLPGDVIVRIDGRPTDRLRPMIERASESSMLRFEANAMVVGSLARLEGESVELSLRSIDGTERTIDVVAATMPGEIVSFGNLPPMVVDVRTRALCANDLSAIGLAPCGGDVVGMVGFSVWLTAINPRFDAAMDEFRDSLGVIIDLRGNPGGLGGMAMGLGGHFFEEPVSLGTMKTRENSVSFRVNPRRSDSSGRATTPIDRPVAILVDEMSASTSEIFAGGMQEAGRARVFGRTTPGAALPAVMVRLPNGDVFVAAMADFVTPKGVRLEGRGVVPDEIIELTPEVLSSGADPDVRAAAAWILEQWGEPEGDEQTGEETAVLSVPSS